MGQPGRQYSAGTAYRYGFNGKENDNEVKGDGNQQDYGMRIYDPRLGRFLSMDPIADDYPWNSPYSFAENDVLRNIDLDGLEKLPYQERNQANGWVDGFLKAPGNAVNQGYNTVASTWNSGVSLLEAFDKGGVPGLFNEIGNRWDSWTSTVESIVEYHKETSIKQQIKDAGSFISNPDNFYTTLEQATLSYTVSRILISNPTTSKPVTTANKQASVANKNINPAVSNTAATTTAAKTVGGIIKGYTKHGLNQAIGRDGGKGVSASSILSAIKNPIKVKPGRNNAIKYMGEKATVILNKDGKIITTYGQPRGPQQIIQGTRKQGSGSAQRKANIFGFSYYPRAIK